MAVSVGSVKWKLLEMTNHCYNGISLFLSDTTYATTTTWQSPVQQAVALCAGQSSYRVVVTPCAGCVAEEQFWPVLPHRHGAPSSGGDRRAPRRSAAPQ